MASAPPEWRIRLNPALFLFAEYSVLKRSAILPALLSAHNRFEFPTSNSSSKFLRGDHGQNSRFQMQVWLFDANSNRRLVWRRYCQSNSIELTCFEALTGSLYETSVNTRLLIFDHTVIGDNPRAATDLIRMLPQDVIAFAYPRCSCSHVMRLINAGASWVFDNTVELSLDHNTEISQLIEVANEHDLQWQRYKLLQTMFTNISSGESEVLGKILEGLHNYEIAEALKISVRTVESRRAKIYRKCNINSIVELVRRADQYEALKAVFEKR